MKKIRHFLFISVLVGIVGLLSGCQLALLNPQGPIAAGEEHIMIISALIMSLVVIPVIVMSFVFAWRYRESNSCATYAPEWAHSTLLEIIWWAIPICIIVFLSVITWNSSHQYDPYKPLTVNGEKTITIEAISLEWKWLFIYPDQNIATINYLEIPKGVPVQFLISAEGPMNSFQIPQLAGQIYAMAGMQTKLNLIANTLGDYRGVSANFTGDGFSEMKFSVHVASMDQFNQWVNTVKQSNLTLSMNTYDELVHPSQRFPVTYFSSANKTIFNMVVMKTMMPMPETGKQTMTAMSQNAM